MTTVTDAILIAGPTASGKSAAALALAKELRGTIINADSMQVYRDLRVLTARPDENDLQAAPHRLYGTVAAQEPYSVGRWASEAAAAIDEAREQGRMPILVGGTGLYFKVLLEGLSPVPGIPTEIRDLWRRRADTVTAQVLHDELSVRDPIMATRLQPSDPQRLVRALEVINATGVSLADWQGVAGTPVLDGNAALTLVVAPEREDIYTAIDSRLESMLCAGAIEEVKALTALGLAEGLPVMRALGVRALAAYLAGTMSLEDAATRAKTESRRYAKRQMTWAKRFMSDWQWFPNPEAAAASVRINLR